MLAHVTATRYVTPLREGGSLPGLMEADDLGTYVVKYRGAGQGLKALVAEVVSAGIARGLGLPVPDLVTVDVDPGLASGEPDEEVQDLLRRSAGLNLGIDFLPGALDFDPKAFPVDVEMAGRVLWFDAVVGNMDRSHRNPNLLQWRGLWLIDHGATLSFHHRWSSAQSYDDRRYDASDHALIDGSPDVMAADAVLGRLLTGDLIEAALADVPDGWLLDEADVGGPREARAAYAERLAGRLSARPAWLPDLAASAARRGRPAP
ncbi:MAG: aminotransferase class I and II [Actinobacteria bacterium]|nr:aminotransferase class I and II [Actinomycetota bacterium]